MNNQYLSTVEWFIIFEFLMVAAIVVTTYAIRFLFLFRRRVDRHVKRKIDECFAEMMSTGKTMALPRGSHAELIMHAFMSWDKQHETSPTWIKIRIPIMRDAILPQAVKFAKSRQWLYRYWLVECFRYYIDMSYQETFIKLIFDKFSLVSISCTRTAIHMNQKSVLYALVNKICLAYENFQSLYITQLEATPFLYEVIHEKLVAQPEARARIACYRMLQRIKPLHAFYSIIYDDLYHENLDVRTAAIRILAAANPVAAAGPLLHLLGDPNWIIRNTVIQSIKLLPEKDILQALNTAVTDENWWVRVNAARVLAEMGEKGLAILEKNVRLKQLNNLQEPAYFLKIHNLLDGDSHHA